MIPLKPPTATGDFETYSEAGHVWDEERRRWVAPKGANKRGLSVVGAAVYAEHPTADILTFSYRLPHWPAHVKARWQPGAAPPQALFDWLAAGGLLECHNVMFERLIWFHVARVKYGWPDLEPYVLQLRCSMATARVNNLPGALGNLTAVLGCTVQKDKDGKRLLDKFSIPRNPTKSNPALRTLPADDPADFERLCGYCDTDVDAEEEASRLTPPMSADELAFWQIDQEINWRGVGIDRQGVRDCIAILDQALAQYGAEYVAITGGLEATQLQATLGWLAGRRQPMHSMDEEAVAAALERPLLPPDVRRVLEIRQLIGSASVKKLYAMDRMASYDNRLRNLIVHHGARTGRPTGEGPQPLNLPKAGPKLVTCSHCARPQRPGLDCCLWCGAGPGFEKRDKGGAIIKRWSPDMADHVLSVMATRSLVWVEWHFGNALLAISGCIRSLFCAAPGYELIASDFSAIEAVVTAMLAGEKWREDAFRAKLDIYLVSIGKIRGRSMAEYEAHKAATNQHHPDRQDGKINELANGFGGWINAARAFGHTGSDQEIKEQILAWRDASPRIVEMWGGQWRGRPWDQNRQQEFYGFEGCAVAALLNPGQVYSYAGIQFHVERGALIITLRSGRRLTYHDARLVPSDRDPASWSIVYFTWNSNPKYGPMGWVVMSTFGGRLTENIVQATAHDILRFAIINLRAAGYHTVLHVYDEIVVEVPAGWGSVEEVERIMAIMPWWAAGWPIRAEGGWRGVRYRKAD